MKRAIQISTVVNILLTSYLIIQALLWVQSFDYEAFLDAHPMVAVFLLLGAYLIRASVYVLSALVGVLILFQVIALFQSFKSNQQPYVIYVIYFIVLLLVLGVEIRIALVFLFEQGTISTTYLPVVFVSIGVTLLMMIPSILTFIERGKHKKQLTT